MFTKTCLHTLLDKCIQMLDNGAEVLCYCDDRALQSRCPKISIIGRFTLLLDTALQPYTKIVKILQILLSVRVTHLLLKSLSLLLFFFYEENHDRNKQACQVLQYRTGKSQKNRYF